MKLRRCKRCGHLSFKNTCHNCQVDEEEWPERITDTWHSPTYFNEVYNRLDDGYGKLLFIGTLMIILSPVSVATFVGLNVLIPELFVPGIRKVGISIEESYLIMMPLLLLTQFSVGTSIYVSAWFRLTGEPSLYDNISKEIIILSTLLVVFLPIIIIIVTIVVALLGLIPVINLLVAVGILFLGLALIVGYGMVVLEVILQYKRSKVSRLLAVSALLNTEVTPRQSQRALSLLLMTPDSKITATHRDCVIEYFSTDPSVVARTGESDQYYELLSSTFSNSDKDKLRLIEAVFTAGQELLTDKQFSGARECFGVVERLIDSYDIEPGVSEIQTIRSEIISQSDEMITNIDNHMTEARNILDDSQYQKAIDEISAAEDLNDEWEGAFDLNIVTEQPSFRPDRANELKKQIRSLQSLVDNLDSIEQIGEGVSYKYQSIGKSSPFQPATEIAKRKHSEQITHVAVNKILSTCERMIDDEEYEVAKVGYQSAVAAAKAIDDSELYEAVKAKQESLRRDRASERFLDKEDYIRDNILAGESFLKKNELHKALQRFRDADEDLPPKVNDDNDETRRELQQRVTDRSVTARRQLLFGTLDMDDPTYESTLKQIRDNIGIPAAHNSRITLPTASEFDQLIECISGIIEQVEVNHSLQSHARTSQTNYNTHSQNISALLEDNIESVDGADDSTLGDKTGVNTAAASKIESAISEANDKASAYAETVKSVARAYSLTSSAAVQQCITNTEKRLVDAPAADFSIHELSKMQEFIEQVSAYDVLVNNFPSLPISQIIQEISGAIESGDKITLTKFDREFNRVKSLFSSEVDSVCTEIELFVNTWADHQSVDSHQWLQVVEQTRNGDEFVELLNIYQTIQTISDNTWTKSDLLQPSWEQFESLVANLYTKLGYETKVTQSTKDFGVDVWASKSEERLAIQVKQFGRGNTVGREVVQKLESTLARGEADKAVVVTSSSFANTAVEYAKNSDDVDLVDANELVRKLIKHDVQSLVDVK